MLPNYISRCDGQATLPFRCVYDRKNPFSKMFEITNTHNSTHVLQSLKAKNDQYI